ncbi:hypothetical protein L226DRAFT_52699 [Lentinus tigrinus ALCF2SS1-7]|uniref:F-box domain-containing protein n=1 Tax=Lentinus tigrinus ALCF2SS1-6 TaxID=1328759 RepID=A0A5C2RKM6_9APHY|nr:hypothetical protein L227DRAFT_80559 [Lentinus tigrinus ALCF2SS1-6]RPD67734.1 hypothetical protein L226DRAFT_52925 [Lentinus tigrinus ALCF2SS1-7]RPD67751.1 hypothetical protein L226DRAFT_52699 [Lentinus tigrinus ALCF2SS1-7]
MEADSVVCCLFSYFDLSVLYYTRENLIDICFSARRWYYLALDCAARERVRIKSRSPSHQCSRRTQDLEERPRCRIRWRQGVQCRERVLVFYSHPKVSQISTVFLRCTEATDRSGGSLPGKHPACPADATSPPSRTRSVRRPSSLCSVSPPRAYSSVSLRCSPYQLRVTLANVVHCQTPSVQNI